MAAGLSELEVRRGDLFGELERLGDFRPGMISVNYRKCGQEALRQTISYFANNRQRMRYADFRRQQLFVGSGVIEAGCKTIVGQRLKQSGMRWSLRGVNAIIALRCAQLSGRWEEFWEMRATG